MYTVPLSLFFCATALLVNGAYAAELSTTSAESLSSAAIEFQPAPAAADAADRYQTLEGLAQPQAEVLPAVGVGQPALWVRIADDGDSDTAVRRRTPSEQPSVRWVF